MAAKERICLCCGKVYQYCPSCQGYDPNKTWMFLVHDENCLDVYNVWQQYRGKEISKEDAAKVLKALNVTDILKSKSPVVPVLKEILDIKDEPKVEEKKEDEKVETKPVEEKPVEEKRPFNNQKFQNHKK